MRTGTEVDNRTGYTRWNKIGDDNRYFLMKQAPWSFSSIHIVVKRKRHSCSKDIFSKGGRCFYWRDLQHTYLGLRNRRCCQILSVRQNRPKVLVKDIGWHIKTLRKENLDKNFPCTEHCHGFFELIVWFNIDLMLSLMALTFYDSFWPLPKAVVDLTLVRFSCPMITKLSFFEKRFQDFHSVKLNLQKP